MKNLIFLPFFFCLTYFAFAQNAGQKLTIGKDKLHQTYQIWNDESNSLELRVLT